MIHASADTIAHLIQTALTPVFLVSGIGTLMQLFNTRLALVTKNMAKASAQLVQCSDAVEQLEVHRRVIRFGRRLWLLDTAIALAAFGAAASCGAAFILFLGGLRAAVVDSWLVALFAFALSCTVASLVVFVGDSVIAWVGLRQDRSHSGARAGR